MWHTMALTEDVATATLTDLQPVPDGIIQINSNHLIPAQPMNLYGATAYGTNLQRVRLTTPRLRQISPVFLRPFEPALVGADDAAMVDYSRKPLLLQAQEEIVVEALQDAGVNQQITVLLHAGGRMMPLPEGDMYVIRATSTTAATANAWSLLTYTMDSQLPAGTYAMACVELIGASAQAARLTFDNQYWRPGLPALTDENQRLPDKWRAYEWGVMGHFNTVTLPRIEALANAATASWEIYFHVIPRALGQAPV